LKSSRRYRTLFLPVLLLALAALSPASAAAVEPPDPLDRGSFAVDRLDPFKAGLVTLQEPNAGGGAPGTGANSSITLQARGVMYTPHDYPGRSPIIVLVHGNHGSCDTGQAPNCTIFKRNDEGYAYLGENLASWGYAVLSLDQDQMIARQDGFARGMHARRLLIAALLDALYEADQNGLPVDENSNIGDLLKGKLDFTRIGLMGHSRGGDAVSSFIDFNRSRPSGRRYPLRGVISLAPVDYERRAPYGVPYMTIFGTCDGDVSNLQGARIFERSQYVKNDPYPRIQSSQVGGNHNWYNTTWFADTNLATGNGDDANGADAACKTSEPDSLRLSGQAGTDPGQSYVIDNSDKLNPLLNTRISGDPARMGDQEKIGLATMSAFFRRYVGGEGAFEPYLTGELAAEGKPQVPLSACPTSPTGTKISCLDRISTSFVAPAEERLDVLRPDTEKPLAMTALGTELHASGFANPYLKGGGVSPRPGTTASGLDWCNPDTKQTEPGAIGEGGFPTSVKACPLPAPNSVGGQEGVREQGPVNQSAGRQLAVAWEKPAALAVDVPAAEGNVSGFKVLALGAAVNYFDPRNPARSPWDPQVGKQDFTIALTDAHGNEANVAAGDPRYGIALQQTHGTSSPKVHVILKQIRVPLEDFAKQDLDLTALRGLELRFGDEGMPASGSIELADVRFQEAVGGTDLLLDSTAPNAGPGEGPPESGPDPMEEIEAFDRAPATMALPNVTTQAGANVWTVDDDRAECPNAGFTEIQAAVDLASPWDTIVICPGLYEESSIPVNSGPSPNQEGAKNGLTIKKPLKILGAGADLVTIRPAANLGVTLAGTEPFLRDGGGNVITISRQSQGSSEYSENFVDISGVTVESPFAYAEAGVAFFNTSGRISDSVVGPIRSTATSTNSLNARPHGWGIVATNSMQGEGPGTILRQVTVADSLVTGYQTGGILFDDAAGKDAAESAKQSAKILLKGVVTGSVVEGRGPVAPPTFAFPQTGIQYHAGASGFVEGSKVSGNVLTADPRKSVGVLLTGAETNDWYAKGTLLTGNGFGLFNANVTNTAVLAGAPATATENFWGSGGTPILGQSVFGAGVDEAGISGLDAEGNPSVLFDPVAGAAPTAPAVPGPIEDLAPSGELVNPGDGAEAEADVPIEPVVLTEDDFGVASVELAADGEPVAKLAEAPYVFAWTPSEEQQGETVTLEATIVDSSGQTTTRSVDVEVKAAPPVEEPPIEEPPVKKPDEVPPTTTPPATPPAPGTVTLGKLKRLAGKGTALLQVKVPGAGELVASGPKVKRVTLAPTAAGAQWIAVEAKGKALATLTETGKVTVKVTVVFTSAAGESFSRTRTVVLVRDVD
jgi:large repetitive protein